jgi:glutamate/tyrosine decarboxylase-like PLP-dependent enzyme
MSSERLLLERTLVHAIDYLDSLGTRPVRATVADVELRSRLKTKLDEEAIPPERVIDELVSGVEGGLVASSSGRLFAWAIGGTLPAALAADWLTSTWDQNAAIHACSPAEAILEEVTGEWLKDLLRLPEDASFALVTGCQAAHTTALAAARHQLLSERGWDVESRGLMGAPALAIYTGEYRHESLLRAARLLGLGTDAFRSHPTREDGRIDLEAVRASFRADPERPTILCLNAGEFHTGAFDDYAAAVEIARRHGAWVHVDGAFGLWAAASERYRHLTRGMELADSWATDGHKWLNVPFDCGYVFTAHPDAHRAAMTMRASYMPIAGEANREQIDWNLEWSRRGRAVPTYAALRSLGRKGVAELVGRCCDHCSALVAGIGALPGAEVVSRPVINQGLVRFLAEDGDHDRRTDEVIARVNGSGIAWFGGTDWRGKRVMRVSVLSHRTTEEDVKRVVGAVADALAPPQ